MLFSIIKRGDGSRGVVSFFGVDTFSIFVLCFFLYVNNLFAFTFIMYIYDLDIIAFTFVIQTEVYMI